MPWATSWHARRLTRRFDLDSSSRGRGGCSRHADGCSCPVRHETRGGPDRTAKGSGDERARRGASRSARASGLAGALHGGERARRPGPAAQPTREHELSAHARDRCATSGAGAARLASGARLDDLGDRVTASGSAPWRLGLICALRRSASGRLLSTTLLRAARAAAGARGALCAGRGGLARALYSSAALPLCRSAALPLCCALPTCALAELDQKSAALPLYRSKLEQKVEHNAVAVASQRIAREVLDLVRRERAGHAQRPG
jgi:hypothetical protein